MFLLWLKSKCLAVCESHADFNPQIVNFLNVMWNHSP